MMLDKNDPQNLLKLKQSNETWQAGAVLARVWIQEKQEDRPYRPYQVLVVDDDGRVLSTEIHGEAPTPQEVWSDMGRAMRRPMLGAGGPRRPRIVALQDVALAEALRPRLAEIGVQVELRLNLASVEEVSRFVGQGMAARDKQPPSLLGVQGGTVPLIGRIYAAAAEFYRLAPWTLLKFETPIEIAYPLDGERRYAVVIGALGEEFGLSAYDRIDDFRRVMDVSNPRQRPKVGSSLMLSFGTPNFLAFDDLDAIPAYGWEVAGEDAYPMVVRIVDGHRLVAPSVQDLFWLEGALPALIHLFKKGIRLKENGEVQPKKATCTVQTLGGPAKARVRIPAWEEDERVEKALGKLERLYELFKEGKYQAVLRQGEKLLAGLPADAPVRADLLDLLGSCYGIVKDFDRAYDAYSQAVALNPQDANLRYRRGIFALFTFRSGQAQRDLQQAVRLERDRKQRKAYERELDKVQRIVQHDLKLRGAGFTLEQLIEQQEIFQQGVAFMEGREYAQAVDCFRRTIAMGDCLPEAQGNLGACLLMQGELDQAEAALKQALAINPQYDLALRNLVLLENVWREGATQTSIEIRDLLKK